MSDASESDEMGNGGGSSEAVDDVSGGGNNQLKKGPWTSAEDAILIEYVTKHGEGNWNAVQKHSGLARCGKSCRLRWANHLRPNLKKCTFSPEEEEKIIELHSQIGNKWAQMASKLPGRTDNEIKNYWNTRIKRRQRAGLPVYPPDIRPQSQNESDPTNTFSSPSSGADTQYPIMAPTNIFDIPVIEFKSLKYDQPQLYPPEPLDFRSPYLSFPSTLHLPPKISQSFMYPGSVYDPSSSLSFDNAVINGNSCPPSEPTWATKLELPSFQTQVGNSGQPCSPLPSESVDNLVQNLLYENQSHLPPQNSGLLDAVLLSSNTSKNGKGSFFGVENSLSQDFHEVDWDQLASPICRSSSEVFSEGGTTPISGNSYDELEYLETTKGCCNVKEATLGPVQYRDRVETRNDMNFINQDLRVTSDCFGPTNEDHSLIDDTFDEFFNEDLIMEFQKPIAAASPPQGLNMYDDSCAWNSLTGL